MVVFLVSVFLTVPSGDSVTVFSLVFTLPSLLTLVLSVLEISRSQPTATKDNANADITAITTTLRFLICFIQQSTGRNDYQSLGHIPMSLSVVSNVKINFTNYTLAGLTPLAFDVRYKRR